MNWPGDFINKIICGDCLDVMKEMPENSVDAIVTDPPYGLEFMGKDWDRLSDDVVSKSWNTKGRSMTNKPKRKADSPGGRHATKTSPKPNPRCRKCGRVIHGADTKKGFVVCHCKEPEIYMPNTYAVKMQLWHTQWLTEAYRVLKPGGSMLVMGGTRTSHRLACAIEDSGFIIKDTLMWLYGSGFPKAQDLGKMIDKRGKAQRRIVGKNPHARPNSDGRTKAYSGIQGHDPNLTLPSTDLAKHWDGFKVGGIKPAYEPIIWAVKPPEGSYVDNVLKWGVGAVNVDECRINHSGQDGVYGSSNKSCKPTFCDSETVHDFKSEKHSKGRFPANIILDEEAGRLLDEQSGDIQSGGGKKGVRGGIFGNQQENPDRLNSLYQDSGGASRFFYCAKASKSERGEKNKHPTVKPIALFMWLIQLITREGQLVLDPFIGSGTTMLASQGCNRKCVGMEKDKDYCKIAEERLVQGIL